PGIVQVIALGRVLWKIDTALGDGLERVELANHHFHIGVFRSRASCSGMGGKQQR
ncbi:hypothetical protein PSYMO_31807, partial [Pseudomonas amygdali pv. mori str. 301020]